MTPVTQSPEVNVNASLLDGIKVLDLSRILAGPWATQLLADYGATVWKIEKPKVGDDTRHWGPPFLSHNEHQVSAYFLAANRGKHSVAIDISQPAGQQLVRQLACEADVLVENFKVGGLKNYSLDFSSLSKLNPRLIYCSITGFGQNGPLAHHPGYDAMMQASGGLMSITGEAQREGGAPQKVGVAVTDLMTGMYATTAILAALNQRYKTGKGQHIDLALLDTQIAMLANQGMNYLVSGKVPVREGNSHPNIVPYQTFCCSNGYIMLAVGNDRQFGRLAELINLPDLANNQLFQTNANRVLNRNSLLPILQTKFLTQTCEQWLTQLNEKNIPCGPVNDIAQAFANPQVKHRQIQFELTSDVFGTVPQVANPAKFSASNNRSNQAPPQLGMHTFEILKKTLGLSDDQVQKLFEQKVVSGTD